MATVTKCDRCGQYIDRVPESLPFIIYKKNRDLHNTVRHEMTLCEDCYERFLIWAKPFDGVSVKVDCETADE